MHTHRDAYNILVIRTLDLTIALPLLLSRSVALSSSSATDSGSLLSSAVTLVTTSSVVIQEIVLLVCTSYQA